MSPRNPVLPLSYLCLKTIASQCIHALSDDEGQHYEAVESYFRETTYEVLQDLLKEILNSVNLDASTRFSCLEVLLREDVRKLDTGIFPRFYYDKILNVIATKGTRLQHLNLKGVWVRDYPQLLCDAINSLKYLRTLIIPHMANDSVIEAIVQLKYLSVLDICGEASYTVSGIKRLKSDVLRVLDIGNFGKTEICQDGESGCELVADILENLPNLTSIKTYSFTGLALLMLYNKNPHRQTKLTYLHDTGTSMEVVQAMQELCPNLESIHIDSAETGVIEELSKFKRLTTLKLTKANGDALMNYLRISGNQVQTLKLNHNKSYSLDLSQICVYSPNIVTLELYQMKLTYTNMETYFMSLQNIEILYCDITDSTLKYILLNTPFLKRIVVGCVVSMTDGDIFRLCAECDFTNLEELWFSYARGLTAISVELLMGHCPKLRVLGQLSGWDMQQEELDYLRSVIISTNTDLTLLPVGSFV